MGPYDEGVAIGISAPIFSTMPFEQISKRIVENFSHWEIISDGTLDLKAIKRDLMDLRSTDGISITIHAPFSDLNLASIKPRIRHIALESVSTVMDLCAEMGINLVTVHPGLYSPLGLHLKDKVVELNARSIIELGERARDLGVCLALENMPLINWTLCNTAEEVAEVLKRCENAGLTYPHVGFCLDVGHANVVGDLERFLGPYFTQRMLNIHLHNNRSKRDEHLPLPEGDIDIPLVLRNIMKVGGALPPQLIIEANTLEEGIRSKKYLEGVLDEFGIRYR